MGSWKTGKTGIRKAWGQYCFFLMLKIYDQDTEKREQFGLPKKKRFNVHMFFIKLETGLFKQGFTPTFFFIKKKCG